MPEVTIKSADGGSFSAYLSLPANPRGPGIITMQQIFGVNAEMRLDIDKCVEDLKSTLAFLRTYPGCNAKVGTVGYCLGGLTAFLMATRSDAECNVSYFGVGIEKYIGEATQLKKPLLLHVPVKDRTVPPEAQKIIEEGVRGKAEFYSYPDADHGFNRVGSRVYDKDVTELARARTAAFLTRYHGA
jgi:carboxymethylenebutenolidase